MKRIKLTQNKYALVDSQDFEYLNQWKWCYDKSNGYAHRKNGKEKIYMHRLINETPEGFFTDHINRNKLDNRRSNLRSVTARENSLNISFQKNNTSGYKGIYWSQNRSKWIAQIKYNYKTINLGGFLDIQSAWLARRFGERIYFK